MTSTTFGKVRAPVRVTVNVDAITSAKQPETRARHVPRARQMLDRR